METGVHQVGIPVVLARVLAKAGKIVIAEFNKALDRLEEEQQDVDEASGEEVILDSFNEFEMAALIVKDELYDQYDAEEDEERRLRITEMCYNADDLFWMSVNGRIDASYLDGEQYGCVDLRKGGVVVAVPADQMAMVVREGTCGGGSCSGPQEKTPRILH